VKKGRGIYKRHFEYIPAHGPGCVDHSQDECQKLDNSNKMHHIRTTCESTEEVGVLECRTRSCHQCEHCWKPSGDWGMCENLEIVGKPEMEYLRPPTHYEQRVLRSHSSLKQQGIEMAKTLQKGSIVALEIDDSKLGNYFSCAASMSLIAVLLSLPSHPLLSHSLLSLSLVRSLTLCQIDEDIPWVLVEVTEVLCKHLGAPVAFSRKQDWAWMGSLRKNDEYFTGKMLVRPRAGVNTFEQSDWELFCFPQDVRVANVEVTEYVRQARSSRSQAPTKKLIGLTTKWLQTILSRLSQDRLESESTLLELAGAIDAE
jgi:hypothetical protein